jgi:serine/threonine protein kinase
MDEPTGFCPSCHAPGFVGSPCVDRTCERRGAHIIPIENFERLKLRPASSIEPLIGQQVDEYLVVDVLGAGGFGKVYLALQQPIQMKAALKVMDRGEAEPEIAEALAKRFKGEASALATLTHPNIVRLLKYGVHVGMPYLVMEFVEGARTLKKELERGALDPQIAGPEVAWGVLRQVLNALDAAHVRGIVHRDVKPDNIMLQEVSGDPWFVKVLDFGLAKFVEERDETSMMVGTPSYMAPEQVMRKNIGPWTDLYALGVLCFRMTTGRVPFPGDSTQEIIARKLDPEFDPIATLGDSSMAVGAYDFYRKALARDPENRFRNAVEFRVAFEKMIAGGASIGAANSAPVDSVSRHLPDPTPMLRADPTVGTVGNSVFSQVGAGSSMTEPPARTDFPGETRTRPRRLPWLLLLAGLLAGLYLVIQGPTLAPVRNLGSKAMAWVETTLDGTTVRTAPAASTSARTISVNIASKPAGARILGATGQDMGRTPNTVLVSPASQVEISVRMDGYHEERIVLTHESVSQNPDVVVTLRKRARK